MFVTIYAVVTYDSICATRDKVRNRPVVIGTDVDHSQTANLILKYTKLTSKYIAVGSVYIYIFFFEHT